ncbi:MAG: C25 family cysteine peptidase [Bacteroidales bacterium]|jgi:hypothetical protein|nr:C25 family cysteine peptidase [Bacteroidales bacterium]
MLTLIFVLTLVSFTSYSQQITYSDNQDGNAATISLSVDSYRIENLTYKGEEMHEIGLSGIFIPNDEGMPNLPRISRFVAIPEGAEVKVSIKSMVTETLENINIAPALRIQAIPEEPVTDYVKNGKVYSTKEFYPSNPVEISEVTSLRGVDAVVIGITPFQYNPVTKELIVIKDIELDINYIGGSKSYSDNKYRSPWFDPILRNAFLNYEALPEIEYTGKSAKDGEGCEYLIVIPNNEDFRPYAEQIKEFRTRQGIYTKIMSLSEMGVTTTAQMKTFFHNAYNTWDIPPVAVLLMGDHNTNMSLGIPAETIPHSYNGSCITDNQYADVTGDLLPEMVFGRMAAETTAQLNVLVSKFLEYETQPCMDASYYQNPITALGWQTERWFQICSEAVGGYWRNQGKTPVRINAIYSGTPGSSWSSNQNTSMVTNYFGPSGTGYIPASPSELGGWTGGTAGQVVTAVNNGAFALQHRDHGFEDGWGEPDFTSSNISQLTNVGKMTYLFTINCLTGKFNNNTPCFGEVFHRYTYNGQNAGAVGFLGPTEVSYSFVNDAYAWGMYDLYDPEFLPTFGPYAENSGNWMPAFGNVAGKYFLYQSSWPYNTGDKQITYQMFTAHSDVFLRLFTEVPQTLAVTHNDVTLAGNTNFLITATEGATIALTANGEILAVATATGSQQTMIIPGTLIPTTEISVVCTKQNYLRYEAVVTVVPAEGPYIIANSWTVNDANGDGILQYNETADIDMIAKNVGVETATNVVMTISSSSEYVTITKNNANFGTINADATASVDDAFTISVSQDTPNNQTISFDVSSTDGNDVWESTMSVRAYRPILEYKNFSWQGSYQAGETLNLNIVFENKGGAPVNNVVGVLTSNNQYVVINTSEQNYGLIEPNGMGLSTYSVTISNDIPAGEVINFEITASGDNGLITAEADFFISNSCIVKFDLSDSYGDGWNGASLNVSFDDGTPTVNYTIQNGSVASFEKEINVGTTVTVSFVSGAWNSECSFVISYKESGDVIYQSSGTPSAGVVTTFVCDCGFSLPEICDPVENLMASLNNNVVTLTWTADASSYIVKRNGTQLGTVTIPTYIDMTPVYGQCTYSVIVVCDQGSTSDERSVEILVEEPCAPITNLVANNTGNNVYLTWNEPNTTTINVVEYKVYRNTVLITTVSNTNYDDIDLINGDYIYCIEAIFDNSCTSESVCSENVNINIACGTPTGLSVMLVDNNISLNWIAPNNFTPLSYNIYKNDQFIDNVIGTSYYDSNLPNDNYHYCVEAVCDEDLLSEMACYDIAVIVCHIPVDFNAVVVNQSVVLSWIKPEFADPISYNLFRNDVLLTENITTTTYTDDNPEGNIIIYSLSANYDLDCEVSVENTFEISYSGIKTLNNDVKIYPNPADNIINIETDEMSRILLYNSVGQLVLRVDVSGNNASINVSQFKTGVYTVDIIGKDNSSIKSKVIITK